MTREELAAIIENNKRIRERVNELLDLANDLEEQLVAPCSMCENDGYDCDECKDNFFSNFKEKE